MLLIYTSRTDHIEKIVQKLKITNYKKITDGAEIVDQNYFLFTYTEGVGQVPEHVKNFVINNRQYIKGVIGSGNKNFGKNFCKAAHIISEKCKVRLIMEFELSGNDIQIDKLRDIFIAAGGY